MRKCPRPDRRQSAARTFLIEPVSSLDRATQMRTTNTLRPGPRQTGNSPSVTICKATSSRDREQAKTFQRRIYFESGLSSGISEPPATDGGFESDVFIARRGGELIGTISLIKDSIRGLPIDENISHLAQVLRDMVAWDTVKPASVDDTIKIFAEGQRCLGEITSLAIDPSIRKNGLSRTEIFFALTAELHRFACETGLEKLVAVAHPKHGKAYRRIFNARPIGVPFRYKKVAGRPAQAYIAEIDKQQMFHGDIRSLYFSSRAA